MPPEPVDPARVAAIVDAVVRRLRSEGVAPPASAPRGPGGGGPVRTIARFTTLAGPAAPGTPSGTPLGPRAAPPKLPGGSAVFRDLDQAVEAAGAAHRALRALPLATRQRAIEAMREATRAAAPELARLAVEETGLGRVDDKIQK